MKRTAALLVLVATALASVALLVPDPATGATVYSCTGNYTIDNPGLQAAINAGGTITILGTCLGNWDVTNDVTFQAGSPGAMLNGNQSGSVLTIHGDVTVWIKGLTITNGSAYEGGGIDTFYDLGTPTVNIVNSIVTANAACYGGGIDASAANLNLTGSTLTQNTAGADCQGFGGAIYAAKSIVTATNARLAGNNSSSWAGAIYAVDGTFLTLTGVTLNGNSSGDYGGAIGIEFGSALNATETTISGNTTGDSGGGIDAYFTVVTLTGSRVTGNLAGKYGGGVDFSNALAFGTATPRNVALSAPHLTPQGRGTPSRQQPVATLFPGLSISNSSIDHNTARLGAGGGIHDYAYDTDTSIQIANSSVSFNNAPGNDEGGIAPSGGGGIATYAYGPNASVTATGTTFQGNLARNSLGGAIFNINFGGSALFTLTQTIVGQTTGFLNQNQALYGGGIYNYGAAGNINLQAGSNVVHNRASVTGGGVFNDCGATLSTAPGALILFDTPDQVFTNLGPCLIN
jgi:hypothetical protein